MEERGMRQTRRDGWTRARRLFGGRRVQDCCGVLLVRAGQRWTNRELEYDEMDGQSGLLISTLRCREDGRSCDGYKMANNVQIHFLVHDDCYGLGSSDLFHYTQNSKPCTWTAAGCYSSQMFDASFAGHTLFKTCRSGPF